MELIKMDFDKVYDSYADMVYSYIRFRIKDRFLAEDILQDTFLSVYRNQAQLSKVRSIKAWLLSIAHNKMVDRLRKTRHEELSYSPGDESNAAADHPQLENNVFIDQLLGQLDETSRQIVYGIYVEGLTCRDMAEILGIPEGTVKSKSFYARAKLREWLEEDKNDAR